MGSCCTGAAAIVRDADATNYDEFCCYTVCCIIYDVINGSIYGMYSGSAAHRIFTVTAHWLHCRTYIAVFYYPCYRYGLFIQAPAAGVVGICRRDIGFFDSNFVGIRANKLFVPSRYDNVLTRVSHTVSEAGC